MQWDEHHPDLPKTLRYCLAAGAFNIFWFIVCTPQQILTVMVRNHLGGSALTLGILVGGINLAGALNLVSVILVGVLKERRMVYFWGTFAARLCAFPVALASFWVAGGGHRPTAVFIVVGFSILASVGNSQSGTAWWAWMGDLIPEPIRARFFGKRSALIQVINLSFFFVATLLIDQLIAWVFIVYGVLYLIAGVAGICEVFTQMRARDPRQGELPGMDFQQFLIPLRDREFRRFCLAMGAFLISVNLAGPFLAPFTVDAKGAGATPIWLGINFVVSQGIWVVVVPVWGYFMDRIGRRAVVVVGGFFVLSWVPYIFMNQNNFWYLLIVSAIIGGLLAPAYWEGISQFMITLSHPDYRAAYAGWFWTWFGLMAAIGPLAGGALYDLMSDMHMNIGSLTIQPLQVLIVLAIVLAICSKLAMTRVRAPREDEDSMKVLLSTIINPGIFRAVGTSFLFNRPVEIKRPSDTGGASAGKPQ